MPRLALGVLVSGNGTNLQALIDAIDDRRLDAELLVVISNRSQAPALDRARRAGVEAQVLTKRGYQTREAYDQALAEILQQAGVEWVALAGFMRLLSASFVDRFRDRVVNIHPSLLPAFPGLDAQGQALDYGVRVSGCTVHLVDHGVDTGPILAQAPVDVWPEDTTAELSARIQAAEHRVYPELLQRIASSGFRRVGRCIVWNTD